MPTKSVRRVRLSDESAVDEALDAPGFEYRLQGRAEDRLEGAALQPNREPEPGHRQLRKTFRRRNQLPLRGPVAVFAHRGEVRVIYDLAEAESENGPRKGEPSK